VYKIIVIVNNKYLETHDTHSLFSFWGRFGGWGFLFRAKLEKERRRKGFFLKHKVFLLNKVMLLIGKYFQFPPWGIEGAFFVSRKARKGAKTQRIFL
jgi:hypothetical protein